MKAKYLSVVAALAAATVEARQFLGNETVTGTTEAMTETTEVVTETADTVAQVNGVGEALPGVVVTGTRNAVDVRHLPMTVTVINREQLTAQHQTSVLPTVMQEVPGLFVTSRSMLGYGVSTGAAGGINMRGITGGAGQLLVLIDGHPQYNGIYGHPISDSYQTLMAERVYQLRTAQD